MNGHFLRGSKWRFSNIDKDFRGLTFRASDLCNRSVRLVAAPLRHRSALHKFRAIPSVYHARIGAHPRFLLHTNRSILIALGFRPLMSCRYLISWNTRGPSFRNMFCLARFAGLSPRMIQICIWIAFVSCDSGHYPVLLVCVLLRQKILDVFEGFSLGF